MSFNKVILLGRLGKDPEIKTTTSGKSVTNFSLATTEMFNNNKQTEWHNIVAWGKTAETLAQYVHKGDEVLLEGKIITRTWEDSTGTTKKTTEIVAYGFSFVGGGQRSASVSEQSNSTQPVPADNNTTPSEDDLPF